jgi:hypothetical protein
LKIDVKTKQQIKDAFPNQYKKQIRRLAGRGTRMQDSFIVKFEVGNHWIPIVRKVKTASGRLEDRPLNRWTAFVRLEPC